MDDIKTRYYEVIKKTSDLMQIDIRGEKKTHSELLDEADAVLHFTLRNVSLRTPNERELILDAVVDMYEIEVGIQTYYPNVLNRDKTSTYWLNKVKSKISHSYFTRYKIYLSSEGFSIKAINNIEYVCEKILSSCANPKNTAGYDKKRGLVVGDVQSGKTANYLGLINMAYDYGYKIVVLLAGNTNSLRIQTQKRTDAGVIGAKSDTIGDTIQYMGVGLGVQDHFAVPFTNQRNDFAKFIQKNLNASIGDFNKPVILVIKKVKSILESVADRLQSELSQQGMDSKSILIIDDEADNASPNTSKSSDNPTTINKCIRNIFNKFPIASYVGFTATPFANVFINPYDEDDDNLDLFPSDFIVQLNSSDSYFGGRKVFPKQEMLPLCLRELKESERNFFPVIHEKYTHFTEISDSLKEAIHEFLINCVIRNLRGHGTKHRSMMINITRFNLVQDDIREKITDYISKLQNEIEQLSSSDFKSFIANSDMKAIYDHFMSDFYKSVRLGNQEEGYPPVGWEQIQAGLYDEIKQVKIAVINSQNGKMDFINHQRKKRFDYEDFDEKGARVIAIGGMVLSRGLTLEGLMTSYYNRNAGTYDTLLQMCRWFGYRPGYEDLCRVYLTRENIDRFDAALEAVEDLKEQFAEMERQGKKPRDFGLMVRESPDTLETTMLITAKNKMRGTDTIEIRLNYGGVYADTSKVSKDLRINKENMDAVEAFCDKVTFTDVNGRYMALDVSQEKIADLIQSLKIPYVNKKFDIEGLSEYIRQSKTFPLWDAVIASGYSDKVSFHEVKGVERSFRMIENSEYIRIGGGNNRVVEPNIFDAGLNLSKELKESILSRKDIEDPQNRPHKALSVKDYLKLRTKPILIVYPIDLKVSDNSSEAEKRARESLASDVPLMAFAVGFPQKESEEKLVYRANVVKLNQLSENLEFDDEDGDNDDD
ncbi:MAG: Z1 domain-containing protein [Clostridia bacterium]|nr:Z1 domain-containing protein [Clostridia bacterium]